MTVISGSASLAHRGLGPQVAVYLAVMLLAAVGCAVGARLHARWRGRTALAGLWVCTAVLWAGVALGAASLGMLLLPAALLAAATSALGRLAAGSTP